MHNNEALATFTIAAALGVSLFTLAYYLRMSAIVVLLIGGVIVGPQGLAIVNPEALGSGLGTIISLAVAIILFEGGLTLNLQGYRSVSKEILRILTIGVLVTWLGTTALLRFAFGFDWAFCLLAASLVIVTGPTVIGPMLHRIRAQAKLHHILHWEGVLIDPIGVFIALLCFEYYASTDGAHELVLQDFLFRFAVGTALGVAFGFVLDAILRREWIDKGHNNIFVLAMAMLNFGLADMLISESGLLSVTVAGLVLGIRRSPQIRDIVTYKVELKDFLIGLLFVLLAANLDLRSFLDYGWKLVLIVAAIMLLIRPLNVFASMSGSSLSLKQKLFLSWIAPRGIVAASMASVFTLELKNSGVENAGFLETFTYSVILATVILQGFTAGIVGRWLGVVRPVPNGWVIIGAHSLARQIARFFHRHGIDAVLIDTNAREVRTATREGLVAINEDAMQLNPESHESLFNCGNLLALTANADLNRMVCRRWMELLEGDHFFRWEKDGYETEINQHLLAGKRIWENLPLNRWMQPESEPAPLHIMQRDSDSPPSVSDVLITARGDKLFPGTPTSLRPEDDEWFVYDPEQVQSTRGLPLVPENVIFSEQTNLMELYREMLYRVHEMLPEIDPQQLLREMWKREEEYTSLLGNGIALPHIWTDAVDQAILVVARPKTRLLCPLTDRPIEIVFMLLSPTGKPKEHLKHLSSIARLIGSEVQRKRMAQANDSVELFHLIEIN